VIRLWLSGDIYKADCTCGEWHGSAPINSLVGLIAEMFKHLINCPRAEGMS
jgi:hypothetical protein